MAVTKATRERLLNLARWRCCLHRLNWLRRPVGPRWETLDIHHVVFQSLGGSDDEENLIPLCPTCHELIHAERRTHGIWMPDNSLLALWQDWKALPSLVGPHRHIKATRPYRGVWPNFQLIDWQSPSLMVPTRLHTYALDINFEAYEDENYKDFRTRIAEDLIQSLQLHDRWFPFEAPRPADCASCHLSSDPEVWSSMEWNTFTVRDVVARHPDPISLEVPAMMAFRDGHQLQEPERLSRTL